MKYWWDEDAKREFDNAYDILCDELYKADGLSYSDTKGTGGTPVDKKARQTEVKKKVDAGLKGFTRYIYKCLHMKYDK